MPNCILNFNWIEAQKKSIKTHNDLRRKRIIEYNFKPNKCQYCKKLLEYDRKNNKFCSSICSGLSQPKEKCHSNETKFKISVSNTGKHYIRKCKYITFICPICKEIFILKDILRSKKIYCSKKCSIYDQQHGFKYSPKPKGGFRPNSGSKKQWYISPIAGKVFLESTWEYILAKELDKNKIKWKRPEPISYIDMSAKERKYYPDFLLEDFNIYLDPKNPFLQKVDKEKIKSVRNQKNIKILILNKEQLIWQEIKKLILCYGAGERD